MKKTERTDVPRVYSYIRFSTPEQKLGDSLRRQMAAAKAYAEKHGYTFDEQLRDEGLSGYHGTHLKKGKFGLFLASVQAGAVPPGSILFVEEIDRLSREDMTHALETIVFGLIKKGITIVTPSGTYDRESLNNGGIWRLIAKLELAHDESRNKSLRLSGAWAEKKRQSVKDGFVLTRRCPLWLRVVGDGAAARYEIISAAAETVQMIFRLYAEAGIGRAMLEQKLNREAPWKPTRKDGTSKGWRSSYIHKILTNRSVMGELQPYSRRNGRRAPEGVARSDFYPRIIEPALFHAAQQRIEKNRGKGGRTGMARNLFSNIAKCPYCGGSMVFIDKGPSPKGGRYLECDNGRRGVRAGNGPVCAKHRVQYGEVQETVLQNCRGLRPEQVLPDDTERSRICQMLRTRITGAEAEHEENNRLISNGDNLLFRATNDEQRERWQKRLNELDARQSVLQTRLKTDRMALQYEEQGRESFAVWQRNLEGLKAAIAPEDAAEARMRLQAHLKELITKVEIFTEGFADRQELGTGKQRRPKALPGTEGVKVWLTDARQLRPKADEIEAYMHAVWDEAGCPTVTRPQLAAFVDYVLKRRMSKEGRFFRLHFTTGAALDLVPAESIASGIQLVTSDNGKESLKFVEPSVSLLWRDFVADSRKAFRDESLENVS